MSKQTVWIVEGHCGEYSDRCDWVVCGYLKEEDAKRHALLAEQEAARLKSAYPHHWNMPAKANAYDAAMQTDYNATNYTVGMIEVHAQF